MIAAVVDLTTLIVINIIVADAFTDRAPDGCELVDITAGPSCAIGWIYDPATGAFSDPAA
jgi:hypothetical protein